MTSDKTTNIIDLKMYKRTSAKFNDFNLCYFTFYCYQLYSLLDKPSLFKLSSYNHYTNKRSKSKVYKFYSTNKWSFIL